MLRQLGNAPGQVWDTFSIPATSLRASGFQTGELLGFNGNSSKGAGETVSVWREGDRGTTPRLEEGVLTPAAGQLQAELPLGHPEESALSY